MQESSTTFCTLDHLPYLLLMQFFHLSFTIFFFIFLQPNIPFLPPGWRHAFQQSAASNSITFSASILPLNLILFVISFITFILCCLLISSSSVVSSCMLCRRCTLYSVNKAKILAQQSSFHFRILYFLLLRTRLHSNEEPLPLQASLLLFSTLYLSKTSSILSANFAQH